MDKYLCDKLDMLTTWLQKRGHLLTQIHVHAWGATLTTNVAHAFLTTMHWSAGWRTFAIVFNGVVWGGYFLVTLKWANANHDYPSSMRMVERLNAKALQYREIELVTRLIFLGGTFGATLSLVLALVGLTGDKWWIGILFWLTWVTPTLGFFLNACFFIGPGEFAKQKQDETARGMVTNHF